MQQNEQIKQHIQLNVPSPEQIAKNHAKTDTFGAKIKTGKSLHKRSTFIIYLIITFAFAAIQSFPATLIPQFERQINCPNTSDIVWLFGARSLGYCFATIIVGIQLDWFNKTHYFASATMTISLIPLIFMSAISNFHIFIVFWVVIGFGTGTMEVSVPVYIWRLYATSASARYTFIGAMSSIGGTLMPLLIQLSLYLFGSYNVTLYLLSFILIICAFFLIVYQTPNYESVVERMKSVKNKNMRTIRTLRNRQIQLQASGHSELSVGIQLQDSKSNSVSQQPQTRKMKTLELLKRTFTQILIDDNIGDVNIFDIEENQNAAEIRMGAVFNPILLYEMNEANEEAGLENIIRSTRSAATGREHSHHTKLHKMLSAGIDNVDDLDVLNYTFSWFSPSLRTDTINVDITDQDMENDSDSEDTEHWFGFEKPLADLIGKMRGKSRLNVLDNDYYRKQQRQYQRESMQFYYQTPTQHGTAQTDTDTTTKSKDAATANWSAMKEGLKRARYKQEVIILCLILMLFFYGWQTVLLANIISFVPRENIGRYLISIYSFSKYMSRFILLILSKHTRHISLGQMTFIQLLLLLMSSFIFWVIGYTEVDENNIYLYFTFIAFGALGAGVKTAVFSICKNIQPVSGFVASICLLSKCFGDGIVPWIVAKIIDKYNLVVYVWVIGFAPFIILTSWICIVILFQRFTESRNKARNLIKSPSCDN